MIPAPTAISASNASQGHQRASSLAGASTICGVGREDGGFTGVVLVMSAAFGCTADAGWAGGDGAGRGDGLTAGRVSRRGVGVGVGVETGVAVGAVRLTGGGVVTAGVGVGVGTGVGTGSACGAEGGNEKLVGGVMTMGWVLSCAKTGLAKTTMVIASKARRRIVGRIFTKRALKW